MEEKSNTGQQSIAQVIIVDGLPPEEEAMSQALYSRKPESILSHLLKVFGKGADGFMGQYYSQYGHNSIGDCGSTTLYFEEVSMLAAKAIQNWSLYNGQEASTRYLDFKGRKMINPLDEKIGTQFAYIPRERLNEEGIKNVTDLFVVGYPEEIKKGKGAEIQQRWMDFYEKHMPIVREYVKTLNPIPEGENPVHYEKAVNARAFDIMRSFIPAGMTTLVSWHSNIRQLRDHLAITKYHPALEISRISMTAIMGLRSAYPASFPEKDYSETEKYLKQRAKDTSYYPPDYLKDFDIDDTGFSESYLKEYKSLLTSRPSKTEVPPEVGEAGVVNVRFNIDFGSYRDAQRHRKGSFKMPLLTTELGFHEWYLERLPEESRKEARALIAELVPVIEALPCSDVDRQYYIPMGFMVTADFTWPYDQCVYVAELRSSETVHPTFRVHAQSLGRWIKKVTPYAAQYVDYSEDKWSFKRGKQDIVERAPAT